MKFFSFLFNSSLGRKYVMALTGIFLVTFLVVHVSVNACIYFNDGGETFNTVAEFFAHNWLIRAMEIVLFVLLILHVVQGFVLWASNSSKRKIKYGRNAANSANSTWYSRSMGLLGTLLLMFLVLHLAHFWVKSRLTDLITSGESTLFAEMQQVFSIEWVVIVYVLGCISLAYHLLHGFQSAFQSMGINHPVYTPMIRAVGAGFSLIVPLVFASMPIAMYMQWIS